MEWLDAHVGTEQSAFQQTPEVLHSIGVNLAVYVLNRVIDDSVIIVRTQTVIGFKFVAVDRGASFDMLSNLSLQSRLSAVIHDEGANISTALHHAHDHGFIFSTSASDDAGTLAAVH